MTLTNVIVGGAGPVCKRIRSTRQGFPEGIKRVSQTPFRVLLLAVLTSARVQGETRRRLSYNAAMPSERDKSNEKRLKWWYFRPWSPLVFCTFAGGFISLLTPSVSSSASEAVWQEAQPLIWTSIGAVVGVLWEWLRRLNQGSSP